MAQYGGDNGAMLKVIKFCWLEHKAYLSSYKFTCSHMAIAACLWCINYKEVVTEPKGFVFEITIMEFLHLPG